MSSVRKIVGAIALSSLVFYGIVSTVSKVSAQPDTTNVQSSSVASQVEFLNGTWEGTYVCRQGLTNLKLVVKAKSTTEIDAVFLFSAHPQNPNVPSGSFRMTGNLEIFNSKGCDQNLMY